MAILEQIDKQDNSDKILYVWQMTSPYASREKERDTTMPKHEAVLPYYQREDNEEEKKEENMLEKAKREYKAF